MKLLLVDDEEIVFKAIGGFLSRVGHQVVTAVSGTQALERVECEVPDVVLSDIRMPEMDGLTLLEIFRVRYPMVPVILITGHGDVDTAVSALQKGAYDYIRKPVKLDELVSRLERVAERKRLEQTLVEDQVSLIPSCQPGGAGTLADGAIRGLTQPATEIRGNLQTLQCLWEGAEPALRRLSNGSANREVTTLLEELPGLVSAMLSDAERIAGVLSEVALQAADEKGAAPWGIGLGRWVDPAVAQATATTPPEPPAAPLSAADLQGN
jgi:DNA-binding response OmpR family regulator